MKLNVRCIFCGKVIQYGDKDAPTSYVVCNECKKAISKILKVDTDAIVVRGGGDEKDKK